MNSNEIFELALGLEKPWYIKEIVMTKPSGVDHGQIDIHIDFEKGFKFTDGKTHDTVERKWQHLNFSSIGFFCMQEFQGYKQQMAKPRQSRFPGRVRAVVLR